MSRYQTWFRVYGEINEGEDSLGIDEFGDYKGGFNSEEEAKKEAERFAQDYREGKVKMFQDGEEITSIQVVVIQDNPYDSYTEDIADLDPKTGNWDD